MTPEPQELPLAAVHVFRYPTGSGPSLLDMQAISDDYHAKFGDKAPLLIVLEGDETLAALTEEDMAESGWYRKNPTDFIPARSERWTITHDVDCGGVYVRLNSPERQITAGTLDLSRKTPGVMLHVDLDKDGRVVGIEIL